MKITNSVVLVVIICALSFVNCKRQKPRHDEIERVINDTHSSIWKCPLVECPLGYGLNVPCGSSIPFSVSIHCVLCDEGVSYSDRHDFSQCKTCTNCDAHEERSGWCSLEEDTIKCLRTCHKRFYWDNLTDSCHPCSKCCEPNDTSHEKQCEGSGLPVTHQCQQTNIVCPDPTDSSSDDRTLSPQDQSSPDTGNLERRTLASLEIGAIVISTIILMIIILVIIVLVWMWRKFGWQRTKTKLGNWFCYCWGSENSNGGKAVHFDSNTWREEEAKIESLQSAPSVDKRPAFLRLFSVPTQSQSSNKVKPAITRSHSHPGCLKDLTKEPTKDKPGSPKKCGSDRRTKKCGKKVYTSVAMFDQDHELPDVIDHDAAGAGNPELTIPRAEPELIITNQDPAEENPELTIPRAEPELIITNQNPAKERNEKPNMINLSPPSFPMKTQSTSTTGLHHLSSTNILSVPKDFETHFLMKKMSSIPAMFYRKICVKLDTSRGCFWDDNRLFGEKIGLSRDEISFLRQKEDTTDSMIQKFNSKKDSSIRRFREIVESMERDDVVSVIDEWIVYEWNTRCGSSAV